SLELNIQSEAKSCSTLSKGKRICAFHCCVCVCGNQSCLMSATTCDSLIALGEFEEAKKVRRMLDRVQPHDEQRFQASIEATINRKRQTLADRQSADLRKLDEKIK